MPLKYNKIYASVVSPYGNGQPDPLVLVLKELCPQGTAVDLGAGDGRNSLVLAKDGWRVIAVDTSDVGLEKFKEAAEKTALQEKITYFCEDITSYEPAHPLNAMLCFFVLHHLTRDQANELLERMQQRTAIGGMHALAAFTPEGDFYESEQDRSLFYPTTAELQEIYREWDIVQLSEREATTRKQKEDGMKMTNKVVRLLAKKR